MPSHTYYIDIDGGFLDSSITNVRKRAIDYLWHHKGVSVVVVYSSAIRNREVGRVIYTGSWPILVWKSSRGRSSPLRKDGCIYPKKK